MKNTALFVLALFLSGCSFLKYNKLRNKAEVQEQPFISSIPIHFKYRTLSVDVVINGKTYQMILDTGAHSTVISRELANALGLDIKTRINVGDSRGTRNELDVALIDKLSIGEVQFYDVSALVVDWKPKSAIACITPDGIIGNHVLAQCNWLIDFKSKEVKLSNAVFAEDSLKFIPMKHASSKPYIDMYVNGKEVRDVLFDTGSGGGLDLIQEDAPALFGPLDSALLIELDGTSQGLYGSRLDTVHLFKADSISLGDLQIRNMMVDVEKNKRKIGHKYFQNGQIYLDYKNERIGITPPDNEFIQKKNQNVELVTDLDSAGLYIGSIVINGAPWKAGLRIGDRVKSVNTKTSAEILKMEYCDYISMKYDSIVMEYDLVPEKIDTVLKIKLINP